MSADTKDTATLTINRTGQSVDFPLRDASVGPTVIDVSKLYAQTGCFTYDPGYTSTGACESKITFINGEVGILLYRGYTIQELSAKSDFLEVCYLTLYGELPTAVQKKMFVDDITYHTLVDDQVAQVFDGFRRGAHPMAMLMSAFSAMAALYHENLDILNAEHRALVARRAIAKVITLGAMIYKHSIGQPYVYPRNDLGYAANFLHMMYKTPAEEYKVSPVLAEALDKVLILHADHEQNASTSTVRLCGSSGANPYAALAAGIGTLWGPAHGGANEAVLRMLGEIGSKERIPEYIEKAKSKDDPFRLMGFGHRVYKNYDPRAAVLKGSCDAVLAEVGVKEDPLLELAKELEKIALEDPYFVEKKLFPNVDFYSGIIYKALGFPTDLFTVLFAIGRMVGWVAQWEEMITDKAYKIGRPRQLFTGYTERPFVNMGDRK